MLLEVQSDGSSKPAAVYLDAAATTRVDPRVAELVTRLFLDDYGNAGSRTHEFGTRARRTVEDAREQIAAVAATEPQGVVWTSGATEANNLALLGLAPWATDVNRRHIVSTAIEHKAVLEPLEFLAKNGFEVEFVPPTFGGWVDPADVVGRIRPDTALVSIMHVNNETGVIQPIDDIASAIPDEDVFLHVDAAQSFGKLIEDLRHERIDMISASGHKLFAPKGVGALLLRRRGRKLPPLTALGFGGGQERGLRPGTVAVPLVAAFGLAAEIATTERVSRQAACEELRMRALEEFADVGAVVNGDRDRSVSHIVNVAFPGADAEAVVLVLKDIVAISTGSACTSHKFEPSHVLRAMQLPDDVVRGAVRFSWTHDSDQPDWATLKERVRNLMR